MISKALSSWFGHFTKPELKKFFILGVIFALTIAINWLLRTLKDSTFITMVGPCFIPHAKWLSFLVSIPLVALYGKLVDLFSRQRLLYSLCIAYGCACLIFAYFLAHAYANLGLQQIYNPLLGWLWYLFVESFGSIMITLFWAFVSDTTTPASAARGYGLIALAGQVGNIAGPLLAERQAEHWGTGILAVIGGGAIFALVPLFYYLITYVDQSQLEGFHAYNEKAQEKKDIQVDFGEGLGLLMARPYLLGIFGIVSFYEIVYAIFDYRFKAFAALVYQGEALTRYFGEFGALTGLVAFLCLLCGISNITRWMGLTAALLLAPLCMGILTLVNMSSNITAVMWVMVFANVLNYALHQPTKEQLYIPTTYEAKYKTKAWIEIFGFRGSKALGAGINVATVLLGNYFVIFSTITSLGLVGTWFFTAFFLGRTHKKAVTHNKLVA